jgi:lipopolysaccharide transport system ATP-binding protein
MSEEPVVLVDHVRKRFRLGQVRNRHPTLHDSLAGAAEGFVRRVRRLAGGGATNPVDENQTLWALDDVSFSVRRGEIVGLVGPNGAGKTTLLKVLSRITEPTSGYARVRGRLGSLLEVGTGFHLELTGRENVFLSGAILGMRRAEIRRRFDDIVAFSELERFIDTPVKFYSSGMYLRLAFAVAAHLEPEILLVDEVLAVGDASFQRKCLAKMDEVAHHGRTILFVSHNMVAMENLCERAIWMRDGRVVQDGPADAVIARYLQTYSYAVRQRDWPDRTAAPGNDYVRIRGASVRPVGGAASDDITVRTPFVLEFEYWLEHPTARLTPSLHVFNEQGVVVFNVRPAELAQWLARAPGALVRDVCRVPGDLLNDGMYRVTFCLYRDGHELVYWFDEVLLFDVRDIAEGRDAWYGKWVGTVRPALQWDTTELERPGAADAAGRG